MTKRLGLSILGVVAIILLCVLGTLPKDEDLILSAINTYYDKMNESTVKGTVEDFTDVLDMSVIQNINKINSLKSLIFRVQYLFDEYGIDYRRNRIPDFDIKMNQVEIDGNIAVVNTAISFLETDAYPAYISSGSNQFVLEKFSDGWKIIDHIYEDTQLFEISRTEVWEFQEEEQIDFVNNVLIPQMGYGF